MANKTTMTAAFAAMLALSTPMALAQSMTASTMHTGTMTHMMPDQIRVTDMNGSTVYDTQNQNIGDVKDVILDKDGRVAAVVLDVGSFLGMGGKMVAVPMNDIKVSFKNNMNKNDSSSNKPRFTLNMTKEQLKSAQAFEFNAKNASTGSSTPPSRDNNLPARNR